VRDGIRGGSSGGLLCAAVVAEIRAVRDLLLTVRADHGFTSTERYKRSFYLLIRIDGK
jgi:hypothetical protein